MRRIWDDWHLWIVISYFAIAGVLVGVIWSSHDSRVSDQRFARSNRTAIVQACEARERIRSAVVLVLREAIAAREETGQPRDLRLARRYQEIIDNHLQPAVCGVDEGRK